MNTAKNFLTAFAIILGLGIFICTFQFILYIFYIICGLILYFLPSIIARRKSFIIPLFMLNLFTGWSLIGWVATLIWSLKKER